MVTDDVFDRWLDRHGLIGFAPLLYQHAIDDVATLAEMTDDELREIGLPIGARKKVRRALDEGASAAPAEPERRQLTVMFCDVVDSTPLSRRLDPEDLAALYRTYTDRCIEVTERYEGKVERFVGDAVLGYFGFPQAHEDDVVRAILAGLEIVKSIEDLASQSGVALAVRVGITTGIVVIGELYANVNGRVNEVIGDTTNLAARVQGAGRPGTVVVTEATRRLAGETLEYEELGEHMLKGIDEPVTLFRVLREKPSSIRFRSRATTPPIALVGREREMDALLERWRLSTDGSGQVAVIAGEPGHGKSRLAHELIQSTSAPHVVIQCSAFHRDSPLYPMIEALRADVGAEQTQCATQVRQLVVDFAMVSGPALVEESIQDHLVGLLALDGTFSAEMSPRQLRSKTMQVLEAWLLGRTNPLLVLVEDVHWADPSTLDLLGTLTRSVAPSTVMLVLTARSEFEAPWPVVPGQLDIHVGSLSTDHAEAIVRHVIGSRVVPDSVRSMIVSKCAGVPLFAEEITRAVLDSVALNPQSGSSESPGFEVPSTLADSLLARLDALGPAKPVSQQAAAIGQAFDIDVLAEVTGIAEPELDEMLGVLVSADILGLHAPGSFFFKHALIRDVAYQTMLRSRRRTVHGHIADALLALRPEDDRVRPEIRARHLAQTLRHDEAVEAWTRAGTLASQRSATVEAVAHFDHALRIVADTSPTGDADRRRLGRIELDLHIRRAGMLRVSRGFGAPETGAAYRRARELCLTVGDIEHLIPTLNGLYSYHLQHDYREAGTVASELLEVAIEHGSDTDLMIGHRAVGVVAFHVGDSTTAITQLGQALALYQRDRHASDAFVYGTDHAATAASFLAMALWIRGDTQGAIERARWAVAHSDDLGHLPSTAQALIYLCFVGVLERRLDVIEEAAPRLIEIAERIAFSLLAAAGRFFSAFAITLQGRPADAIEPMVDALDAWRATNSHGYLPFAYACLAETYGLVGRSADGLRQIDDGLELAGRSAELWCTPELERVRAVLLVAERGDAADIDGVVDRSQSIARSQGARAWQLRTAATQAERLMDADRPIAAAAILRGALVDSGSWSTGGHDAERASTMLLAAESAALTELPAHSTTPT